MDWTDWALYTLIFVSLWYCAFVFIETHFLLSIGYPFKQALRWNIFAKHPNIIRKWR